MDLILKFVKSVKELNIFYSISTPLFLTLSNNMNRLIKSRAWDRERKEWQYFTLEQLAQGEASLIWTKLENWCQFTGLHDKNGKEIYEGDILKDGWKNIGVVKVEEGWIDYGLGYLEDCLTQIPESEVIGNVFENKDLLCEK